MNNVLKFPNIFKKQPAKNNSSFEVNVEFCASALNTAETTVVQAAVRLLHEIFLRNIKQQVFALHDRVNDRYEEVVVGFMEQNSAVKTPLDPYPKWVGVQLMALAAAYRITEQQALEGALIMLVFLIKQKAKGRVIVFHDRKTDTFEEVISFV
jgi:hypothetical protein